MDSFVVFTRNSPLQFNLTDRFSFAEKKVWRINFNERKANRP